MKTKYKLTCFFIVLLSSHTFLTAQLSSYDLSKYEVPDVSFHQLLARGSFGQNSFLAGEDGTGQFQTDETNFNLNLNLRYNGFVISRKRQNTYNLNTTNNLSFNNSQSGNSNVRTFNWRNSINAFNTIRIYKPNETFYEWTTILSTSLQGFNFKDQSLDRNRGIRDFSFIMPLRLGFGRIENVSFAQQALFILRKLKEEGKIKKRLSNEEITAFADAIAQIRSRRIFDFRLRRIFELEQLDQFLMEHQMVEEQDIRYFALLNDQWIYGSSIQRGSGYRFSFAVHPGIIYNNQNIDGFGDFNSNLYSLLIGLELVSSEPLNQYWQRSFEMSAYAGFSKGNVFDDFTNVNKDFSEPKTLVNVQGGMGFYPNTRTRLDLNLGTSVNVSLSESNNFTTAVLGLDGTIFQAYLDLNFTYFLLPRLRLDIDTRINHVRLLGADLQQFPPFSTQMLNFLQYPNCNNFNCGDVYLYSKRFQQLFNVTLNYELF